MQKKKKGKQQGGGVQEGGGGSGGGRGGGMTRGGKWEKLGQERRKAIVPRGLCQRLMGRSEVGCAAQQKR